MSLDFASKAAPYQIPNPPSSERKKTRRGLQRWVTALNTEGQTLQKGCSKEDRIKQKQFISGVYTFLIEQLATLPSVDTEVVTPEMVSESLRKLIKLKIILQDAKTSKFNSEKLDLNVVGVLDEQINILTDTIKALESGENTATTLKNIKATTALLKNRATQYNFEVSELSGKKPIEQFDKVTSQQHLRNTTTFIVAGLDLPTGRGPAPSQEVGLVRSPHFYVETSTGDKLAELLACSNAEKSASLVNELLDSNAELFGLSSAQNTTDKKQAYLNGIAHIVKVLEISEIPQDKHVKLKQIITNYLKTHAAQDKHILAEERSAFRLHSHSLNTKSMHAAMTLLGENTVKQGLSRHRTSHYQTKVDDANGAASGLQITRRRA